MPALDHGHSDYLQCGHVCLPGTDHWCWGLATGVNQWEDAFAELLDTQLEVEERAAALARKEQAMRARLEAVAERERMVAEKERAMAEAESEKERAAVAAENERKQTGRARLVNSVADIRWP